MSKMTLADLSKRMGKIDFAMLTTRTEGGQLATRPMSNNGEVDYDGASFYFTYEASRTVADIGRDPRVGLSFRGKGGITGGPGLFIAVEGEATLLRDRAAFEEHWTPDLERWFPQGTDTPGLVLVQVHASRIHHWDGGEDGEVEV